MSLQLRTKICADGATHATIAQHAKNPPIRSFTTNPALMRKAGFTDYEALARGMHAKRVAPPEYLDVLGNGSQAKPYLRVTDRAAGILYVLDHALQKDEERLAVYNLGPADVTSVRRIAELCVAASPHKGARIGFGADSQGWPGDMPISRIKPDKLAALGFSVRYKSEQAVQRAVSEIAREVFGPS